MTTLYVRDVPEEVAAVLKRRAAAEGQSLSAFVNAQLARVAARPTNAEIAQRLRTRSRDAGASTAQIVDALRDARR